MCANFSIYGTNSVFKNQTKHPQKRQNQPKMANFVSISYDLRPDLISRGNIDKNYLSVSIDENSASFCANIGDLCLSLFWALSAKFR